MMIFKFVFIQLIYFNGILMNFIEKNFDNSIEKILLFNENLFIGTINSLHRLSSNTLQTNFERLQLNQTKDEDFHWKIFSLINSNEKLFLLCGTINQGTCQLIDENFNRIWNSSSPIVANDPINSTISLIIPEENLIYMGVTNTNNGYSRWQIPNISGRSLNLRENFLKIYSIENQDQRLLSEDLAIRFLPRYQTSYIVQYIYSFYTNNYIYFLANQPDEFDSTQILTKILRFCRNKTSSILRTYAEMPLNCFDSNWILKSAKIIFELPSNQMILIGHFGKVNETNGTKFCFWNVENEIDQAFFNNYQTCYSKGIGQTGLHFLKPIQSCQKDQSWSKGMKTNEENICPWIINDRLPYPLSGKTSIDGHLFYENLFEMTSSLQIYSYGSSIVLFQGLINSTFKLGTIDLSWNINWIYSNQLQTNSPIFSDVVFDQQNGTLFFASGSKIFRWSFEEICSSKSSCEDCLSSSNVHRCGWCSINERCTLLNNCPFNAWQQNKNQCIKILNIQPLNSSIDQIQWINITFSNLPKLEDNDRFQCQFFKENFSIHTQAIEIDSNRLSCPTPIEYLTKNFHISETTPLKINISIIQFSSNVTLGQIDDFHFSNFSIEIEDFSPKYLSIQSETIVEIKLNQQSKKKIVQITLADLSCLILNLTNETIFCRSYRSNSSRIGRIKISFENFLVISSKDRIEYRQMNIVSIHPSIVYQYPGRILHLYGENLLLGNIQEIFFGNFQCLIIEQITMTNITCRLPKLAKGLYNLTIFIDKKSIENPNALRLKVTENPTIEDVHPLTSFASGGRLVTVRGNYLTSTQSISLRFSHEKFNKILSIDRNELVSIDNERLTSFQFRTPSIELDCLPIDIDLSINFDDLIIYSNIISFHYIDDILFNLSNILPKLIYTGEQLRLRIENLTNAASIDDIEILINCDQCSIESFTSKEITCQPPQQLFSLNQSNCSTWNSSIGSIRFRLGYHEYLIGYLSYEKTISSSKQIFISFISTSCLLFFLLLLLSICLCIKHKTSKEKNVSSSRINMTECWSTQISSNTPEPYYQIYEQIPSSSSSSHICPYHQYSTFTLFKPKSRLKILSIEHQQLNKLFFTFDFQLISFHRHPSMEYFYDLLQIKSFSQSFQNQLIQINNLDFLQSYIYLFRFHVQQLKTLPLTREISYLKFLSNSFLQTKDNLIELFELFDYLIANLIDFLDQSPTDQILNRSFHSLSSTNLLFISNFSYKSLNLSINYENLFHFNLQIYDCDTIDQIKQKLLKQLNFHEEIDLLIPLKTECVCKHQIPMIKHYSINSTIFCRKRIEQKRNNTNYIYHLTMANQSIIDKNLIDEKLKENKKAFQKIFVDFLEKILQSSKGFSLWKNEIIYENSDELFRLYIQLITDLIRKINCLNNIRSTCPIIQSSLNSIADGIEFIFQTKHQFSSEIEFLYEDDRRHFSGFDRNLFRIPSDSIDHLLTKSSDIRSTILQDPIAIQCLSQLYRFYQLHSQSINKHIGENHVNTLIPIHHLLLQIQQSMNPDFIQNHSIII